jgi:Tfp pilus assembly protein PilN
MTTLTVARAAAMPRVNLLPPEIGEAAKFRRLQMVLGAVVLGALGIVIALWFMAKGDASAAQNQLDDAGAQQTQLQAQVAQYADVPAVYTAVSTAQGQLSTAMAGEIRWSFLLGNLSLTIPDTSRLTDFTATEVLPDDPSLLTTPPVSPVGTPGIGTITFAGKANNINAVAAWLVSLSHQKAYADPYLSTIAKSDTSVGTGKSALDFTSSVTIDADALSHRFDPKVGQ